MIKKENKEKELVINLVRTKGIKIDGDKCRWQNDFFDEDSCIWDWNSWDFNWEIRGIDLDFDVYVSGHLYKANSIVVANESFYSNQPDEAVPEYYYYNYVYVTVDNTLNMYSVDNDYIKIDWDIVLYQLLSKMKM